MKGGPLVLVVLICSFAIMVFTQQKSTSMRFDERARDYGSSYLTRSKVPTAGLDAVVADFLWMRTLQRKSPRLDSSLSREEKKTILKRDAKKIFASYSSVVSLDPTFKKAYDFAMLKVMTDLPDEAIKIAEMGMIYCPDNKKEIAELAGHIAATVRKDNEQALGFYSVCVEGGPHKEYIGNRYLRTFMRTKGIDPDEAGMPAFANRIMFNHKRHKTILEAEMLPAIEGEEIPGESPVGVDEGMHGGVEEIVGAGSTWVQPIVIGQIKNFMNKALTNEVDKRTLGKIKGVYESYRTSEEACRKCLQPYEAGDKFCFNCGEELEMYGACLRDGTVLRGDFCHLCGLKKGQKPN